MEFEQEECWEEIIKEENEIYTLIRLQVIKQDDEIRFNMAAFWRYKSAANIRE